MVKTGLVIGTYGAIPYINLQLESRKRNYPNIPTLINDDYSPSQDGLKILCNKYGADFISNNMHMPDHYGDLSVFVHGLNWAKENNIDLLMKVSRRFIPLFDWTKELEKIYSLTDAATFSNFCSIYGFGFRTECVAIHVPTWDKLGFIKEMEIKLNALNGGLFMEEYIHKFAQRASLNASEKAIKWFSENPQPKERNGYAPLNFMGTTRVGKKENILWHNYTHPLQYWSKAIEWGLYTYKNSDFFNPNS